MDKEKAIKTVRKLKGLACGNLRKDADELIQYMTEHWYEHAAADKNDKK